MAQRAHVPKFGDFESDNDVPYTAYFENMHNDKGIGVRMNPNDPEENPEAFMFVRKGKGVINDSSLPISAHGSSEKSIPMEKQQKYHRRDNSRCVASGSGTCKSSNDNFLNRNCRNNIWKTSMAEYDYYVPPSPGPDRHRASDLQQRPHVPKFGDFESDNDVPYTAYFENMHSDKGTGVRMNPNDPEENPEALMFARKGNKIINDSFLPVSAHGSSKKSIPVEKQQKYHRRDNSRCFASESGSDTSSTDNFLNRNRGNNIRKKSMAEYDYYVPPSPGPDRHILSNMSYASASVPKFGAWDEKDAKSGEGFTVIFNKVKEEKQIAASKFPFMASQVAAPTKASNEKKNKSKSKIHMEKWCCLFRRETDY